MEHTNTTCVYVYCKVLECEISTNVPEGVKMDFYYVKETQSFVVLTKDSTFVQRIQNLVNNMWIQYI
jgi:hypothetical protein